MKTMLLAGVAALSVLASAAHAKPSRLMTINLVGDWCFADQDETYPGTHYQLPSWSVDGQCDNQDKILSITPWSFNYNDRNEWCDPTSVREKADVGHTGTSYTTIVTARCERSTPQSTVNVRIFRFDRYKGNLYVTSPPTNPFRAKSEASQPKEGPKTKVCRGEWTDMRKIGLSIGECRLNNITDNELNLIKSKCGQPWSTSPGTLAPPCEILAIVNDNEVKKVLKVSP